MPEQSKTTHVILAKKLILYRRVKSPLWQCRYKVAGRWLRASTHEDEFEKAKSKAIMLMGKAEGRVDEGKPVLTRRFSVIAKSAITRMQNAPANDKGKKNFPHYIAAIDNYLIPAIGKQNIDSIDYSVLDELNQYRIHKMQKAPKKSTLQTHNAALNRVFDEAVIAGYLTKSNIPTLDYTGEDSTRRAAFTVVEIRTMFAKFDEWIEQGRNGKSRELRELLRDYVHAVYDTGTRPGEQELMGLRWNQIRFDIGMKELATESYDAELHEVTKDFEWVRRCNMPVTGKRGTRTILGSARTVAALKRIAERNYGKQSIGKPFAQIAVAENNDYVFRLKDKSKPTSFQKLFESFLREYNLLIDPITKQKRVFYSLRHTFCTFKLEHTKIPAFTIAVLMGTSVEMIKKYYGHLDVLRLQDELLGDETEKLLREGIIDRLTVQETG